jgi:hypothetical protein
MRSLVFEASFLSLLVSPWLSLLFCREKTDSLWI